MPPKNALALAAQVASTSYSAVLAGEELKRILQNGEVPARFHAHIITLLDEAPEILVLAAVDEAATVSAPVEKIMNHLSKWAHEWQLSKWK